MQKTPDDTIVQPLAKLSKIALGIALGTVFGCLIFSMTVILLLKGGNPVGPHLALVNQFFPGYTVTYHGSLIGFAYGFGIGFTIGWLIALLHNLLATACLFLIQLKSNLSVISDYMDVAEQS